MIYAIYIYTSYVWHRLILLLPAWIAFNQCMKENTSWSSQDHSSHTRKEAPFWQLTLAQVSHKVDAVCHRVNPRCPVPPTKASKNCHAAPSLPMIFQPRWHVTELLGRRQLSNASIGRDRGFWCRHPTSYRNSENSLLMVQPILMAAFWCSSTQRDCNNPWHWLAQKSHGKKPHIGKCRYFQLFFQVTGMFWNALLSLADLGWSDLSSSHVLATRTQRCSSRQRKPSGARFNRFFSRNYSTKWWGCHDPMTNQAPFVRLGRYGSLGKRHVSKSSTFTIPMPAVAAPLPTSISTNTIAP